MDEQDRQKEIRDAVSAVLQRFESRYGDIGVNIEGVVAEANRNLRSEERSEITRLWGRTNHGRLSRREFLKLLGITTGGVAVAATVPGILQNRFPVEPTGFQTAGPGSNSFQNTVNLGEEGLSNGDDIGSYLTQHVSDNTLITIPKGEYTLSSNVVLRGSNWMVGAPEGCRIRNTSSGTRNMRFRGENWRVSGIIFENSPGVVGVIVEGANWLLDSSAHVGPKGDRKNIVYGAESGTKGVIARYYRKDEGSGKQAGFWELPSNNGDVWLNCCHIREFPSRNAAVYGAHTAESNMRKSKGTTHCDQSYFYDCHSSNMKSGDIHGKQSVYRDSVFHIENPPRARGKSTGTVINALAGDHLVENCDITVDHSSSGIQIYHARQARNLSNYPIHMVIEGGNYSVTGESTAFVAKQNIETNNLGENPSTEPPECVPMSPEEAVSTAMKDMEGLMSATGSSTKSTTDSQQPC